MVNLREKIKEMRKKGVDNSRIIEELKNQGNSNSDIYNSLDKEGSSIGSNLEPPSPSREMNSSEINFSPIEEEEPIEEFQMPTSYSSTPTNIPKRQSIEEIEEIAEAVVEEKIQELSSLIGDINIWKEQVNSEMSAIKQEVLRIRNQLENLQATTIGKVDVYNKSLVTMSTEIRALSKVMEKIMEPLTTNVKELSRITEKFKKV